VGYIHIFLGPNQAKVANRKHYTLTLTRLLSDLSLKDSCFRSSRGYRLRGGHCGDQGAG
jgi:hypothetical protein